MDNLVFVHGFLGGGAQWAEQVTSFSSKFKVVTPDLPGFGSKHGMAAPDRVQHFADAVLAELDGIGVSRFHLVGHSMGGMIVQEMVAIAPERVDNLVLYGTGPVGLLPGRFESIEVSKRRASEEGVEATSARIATTWFVEGKKANGYQLCAGLGANVLLQTVLAGLSAMESWSGQATLSDIKSRALILCGDGDRTYPWSQTESLWNGISNAGLAVVPASAHMVHLEKPEIFNALLMDFLSNL
jgi:pimeloyl-ACP methyl ester carboxylesterase